MFNNTGTVNVNTGTLYLQGGGNDSAGSFVVPAAGTLEFGGGVTTLASAVGKAGTLAFNAGTTTVTGTITGTGSFTIAISGGIVDLEKAESTPILNLSGGTLTGSAAVTVTKTTGTALTWSGNSTMSGTGSTTLAAGATMSLGGAGASETLDGRTFDNQGTVNWLAGSYALYLDDGAQFDNKAGAKFNANAPSGTTQYIDNNGGSAGTFANAGTFTNAPGAGDLTEFYDTLFNNTGTVNVNTGTLYLQGGGNDSAGTFLVPAAGTLQFGAGVTALAGAIGTTTTKAAGTVAFSGGITTLTSTITGTTSFTIKINGGIADFEKPVSIPILNLTGGTLTGSAAVTVTATTGTALTWNGSATMSGTGSTTLAAGATMSLGGDGTAENLDGRTFNNRGTVNWLTGSYLLYLSDGALFSNTGTFNANATSSTTQSIYNSGSSGTFANAGTFNNAPGAGNTTEFYNTLFNNTGTVNVNTGTLALLGGGNDSAGTFFVPTAGTLLFEGGVTALASAIGTTTTTAAGTVAFSAGTTTVTGTITAAGNFTIAISGGIVNVEKPVSIPILDLTGGTLTGSAAVTVTATTGTALTWNGGATMSGTGSTTLAAGATMSLGGDGTAENLDGRTFNNLGIVNWLTGSYLLYLSDGALFSNTGTFNANAPSGTTQYIYNSGSTGTFANAGTFNNAAGAGNTTEFYNTPLNNTGTVNVNSGTLDLQGGGTSTGSWVAASSATLWFNGGIANLSASSTSITGAGAVAVSAGAANFGGTYNLTGATSVSGGTANFLNGGNTGTFSNSGGTVDFATGTTFTVSTGGYTQTGGSTYLNGGTLAVIGSTVDIQANTYLYGPGTVTGDLSNEGYVYVGGGGSAAGTLSVSGDYTQSSAGALYVNIGGATAGTQDDQMLISGTASLDGTLGVSLVNGYSPVPGTTFTIMTYTLEIGDFSTKNLGGLTSGSPGLTSYVLTA